MYRILHLLPDLQLGGGQIVLLRHLAHMDRARFSHRVCYLLPHRDLEHRFERVRIPTTWIPHRGWLRSPWTLRRLTEHVRDQEIDLIHTNGTLLDKRYGQLAALLCGVPVVNTLHGIRPRPRRIHRRLQQRIRGILEARLDRSTLQHVIAVSEPVRDDWEPLLRSRGLADRGISVIYSGIPVDEFRPPEDPAVLAALRRELEISDAHPVLLTITRLVPAKGLEMLVPLMEQVSRRWPRAKLLIVGEGDRREELETRIRSAGLERAVALLGRREDIAELLALCDLLVFPSQAEGFGLVVLEAMAAGKPVVAFALPPLRKLARDGLGIRLVEERTPGALAAAVTELLDSPEHMRRIGEHARKVVAEDWDVRRSADEYQRVYEELIRAHPRSRKRGP